MAIKNSTPKFIFLYFHQDKQAIYPQNAKVIQKSIPWLLDGYQFWDILIHAFGPDRPD